MPPSIYDRFRQGEASAYARRGDYRRASATVNDPDQMASYADLANDADRRRREEETMNYRRGYGQSLAAGDYGAAETMAGKFGDIEGLEGARDQRQAGETRDRYRGYLVLRRYADEMEALGATPDPQSAYAQLRARAAEESAQSPELVAEIQRLPEDYETASRVVPAVLNEWMNRLLTPEQLAEMEVRDRRERVRAENNWETDDRGRPYRIVNGRVEYGEGQVYERQPGSGGGGSGRATYRPLTPEEAAAYGLPNNGAGYAMGSNGRPVRVATGRGATAGAQSANALIAQLEDAQNVLGVIAEARDLAGDGETGFVGGLTRGIEGTRSYDLDRLLDTIRASIGFEALAEMRANSPTGGALGSITERELALLQSVVASLDQGQSREQFLRNLDRVQEQFVRSYRRIREAYEQEYGDTEDMLPDDATAGGGLEAMSDEDLEAIANGGR